MKIAVMMAAFNAAPFIGAALRSLLSQASATLTLEVVVVDDGSTDETAEVVSGIDSPAVRLVRTVHQGVAAARNAALEAMGDDADFFTSLDADDLSPAGRLVRDLSHFRDDPDLDLVYGRSLLFRQAAEDGLAPAAVSQELAVRGITLGSGLYRMGLIRRTGRFDPAFEQGEDLDFFLRIFEQEPNYKVIDDICLYYRRHDRNMTRDAPTVRRGVARAILNSTRRRRIGKGGEFPKDIFDLEGLTAGAGW